MDFKVLNLVVLCGAPDVAEEFLVLLLSVLTLDLEIVASAIFELLVICELLVARVVMTALVALRRVGSQCVVQLGLLNVAGAGDDQAPKE